MRTVVLLLVVSAAGCGPYLQRSTEREPPMVAPARAAIDREETAEDEGAAPPPHAPAADPSFGFAALGDPALAALVAEAVEYHRDVLAGLASIRAARALADQARASRLPSVSL